MRQLDPEFRAELEGGATTLCRCWRIRRRDGLVLGFTDHDRSLHFDGTDFEPGAGLDASALQMTNGLAVDNAQTLGALSDDCIREEDLKAGRYDGAEVDHWLVDWRKPERRVHLFRGSIGEIKHGESWFEAEVRGLTDRLNVPVGRIIKRSCDRVLGDERCRVDLEDPRFACEATVIDAPESGRIVALVAGHYPSGWFVHGALHWLKGANRGTTGIVAAESVEDDRRTFRLVADPPLPVAPGDRFRVVAGCDKRAETCRDKFSNFLNFRGFPHIPGEDWVVVYPRKGERHDGSSLRDR
jgi:uncharacterized phage protein (TIGR02218 family)